MGEGETAVQETTGAGSNARGQANPTGSKAKQRPYRACTVKGCSFCLGSAARANGQPLAELAGDCQLER